MMFKVVILKGKVRTTTEMSAVEIFDKYGQEIRVCDLHKNKAPIVVHENNDLKVKVYGYH